MPKRLRYEVEPGGLSVQDRERIFELAERGWTAGRIGSTLRKHPSTVRWFMYRSGLATPNYGRLPSVRGTRIVKPFTPEEDAFISGLRTTGYAVRNIAWAATKKFGHPRSPHTVACRLVMIAALQEATAP